MKRYLIPPAPTEIDPEPCDKCGQGMYWVTSADGFRLCQLCLQFESIPYLSGPANEPFSVAIHNPEPEPTINVDKSKPPKPQLRTEKVTLRALGNEKIVRSVEEQESLKFD